MGGQHQHKIVMIWLEHISQSWQGGATQAGALGKFAGGSPGPLQVLWMRYTPHPPRPRRTSTSYRRGTDDSKYSCVIKWNFEWKILLFVLRCTIRTNSKYVLITAEVRTAVYCDKL